MRVIQISGFRGMLTVIFIVTCLAAGFIGFPALVAMKIWNFVASYSALPSINIVQGLMLWAITAISWFIINDRKKYLFAFNAKDKLSDAEIQHILNNVKAHGAVLNNTKLAEDKDKENI